MRARVFDDALALKRHYRFTERSVNWSEKHRFDSRFRDDAHESGKPTTSPYREVREAVDLVPESRNEAMRLLASAS